MSEKNRESILVSWFLVVLISALLVTVWGLGGRYMSGDGYDGISIEAVLTYHVVAGELMAADFVKLKTAKTVQGQEIKIDASKWRIHKYVKSRVTSFFFSHFGGILSTG